MPIVGVDYMCMHSEQDKDEEKGVPILVMKDSRTKMMMAKAVQNTGAVDYAARVEINLIEQLGCRKLVIEPTISALSQAVRTDSDVDIILEELTRGDHQACGLVRNVVKNVQDQCRVPKDVPESRHDRGVEDESQAAPLEMHAALVINRGRKDEE
jgi:hypothetical protein